MLDSEIWHGIGSFDLLCRRGNKVPEFVEHEQLEERLLQELQVMRRAYVAKECTRDEYVRCLDRLNALVVRGVVPGEYKAKGESA